MSHSDAFIFFNSISWIFLVSIFFYAFISMLWLENYFFLYRARFYILSQKLFLFFDVFTDSLFSSSFYKKHLEVVDTNFYINISNSNDFVSYTEWASFSDNGSFLPFYALEAKVKL